MCHANEDESADDDVECRVPRDEYQDAPCVCCQPYVVLTNEQLGQNMFKVRAALLSKCLLSSCLCIAPPVGYTWPNYFHVQEKGPFLHLFVHVPLWTSL